LRSSRKASSVEGPGPGSTPGLMCKNLPGHKSRETGHSARPLVIAGGVGGWNEEIQPDHTCGTRGRLGHVWRSSDCKEQLATERNRKKIDNAAGGPLAGFTAACGSTVAGRRRGGNYRPFPAANAESAIADCAIACSSGGSSACKSTAQLAFWYRVNSTEYRELVSACVEGTPHRLHKVPSKW
jgi:hypothetical protein